MPTIKEKLVGTGKARYLTFDFPLDFHPQAKAAAVSARCAGEQDRFWEMHEAIFRNQKNLRPAFYHRAAAELELDTEAFGQCMRNPEMLAAVEADRQYGIQLGVAGTPKFFIGKVDGDAITDVIEIDGAQDYAAFARAIERLEKI